MLFSARLSALVLSLSILAVPPAEAAVKKKKSHKAKAKVVALAPATPPLRNWGLDNTEYASHIEAKRAWKITEGSNKVIVAVIDTGIDFNHPDLKNNLWHKPGTDEFGYDFVFDKPNPPDVNGHGSHIAGIIGATANPLRGVVGVSPHVSIMPLRYFADDSTNTDTVANTVKAVDYAIKNGAKIINYSSEGKGFNVAEYKALERAGKAGILVVVAAGNSGENNDTVDSPTYPASYDLPNLIAVAATNIHNELLPISNYGATKVHVAAPGESIFSTMPHSRYGYNTGTSQATAFVSGVAALLLSENPSLTPADLKKIIMSSVDKSSALKNKVASGGRLNAFKAVLMGQATLQPGRSVANVQAAR
jgi:subtilisin family serine protease